ncbi:MAG TPA: hypothetical protein DIT75_02745 [Rikenellaceae bacterium]|mgnify:FL=1|nr:hypothetical protein [Rikenellaceae bacterium]
MSDNDWLKDLKRKMNDYEEPAPKGLWEDVESSLFPKAKRAPVIAPIFWRSMVAAAVVALGVFVGLRFFDSGTDSTLDNSQRILALDQPSSAISNEGQDSSVEVLMPEADVKTSSVDVKLIGKRPSSHLVAQANSLAIEEEPSQPEPIHEEEMVEISLDVPDAKDVQGTVSDHSNHFDHEGEDWSNYISASDESRGKVESKAVLEMSFSGTPSDSHRECAYDLQMFYRGSSPASAPSLTGGTGDNIGDDAMIQTRGIAPDNTLNSTTVISKSDHKRPVRFALTVNYPLGRRFGIETGVAFTTLRSTFTNEVGKTVSQTEQTLRYVGIPLNASAFLLDAKWVSLYLSAGGMVEKCVSGSLATSDMLSGVMQGEVVKTKVNDKGLLWSLNASAGIQANISKNFGIYVEPGLSYHFDDGSDLQTIYKERPLDFMMTFGARITFK